jgi:hypothetical protein
MKLLLDGLIETGAVTGVGVGVAYVASVLINSRGDDSPPAYDPHADDW